MRVVTLLLVAAAVLAVPVSAAEVNPRALVLRQADVPSGFRLTESGFRTKAKVNDNDLWALYRRWGHVSGYQARFERSDQRGSALESGVELFGRPRGARMLLDWVEQRTRRGSFIPLQKAHAGVGSESRVYWAGSGPNAFTFVVWRHDRVFAGVSGWGLDKAKVLALARVLDRRIAAALRD